MRPSDRLVKYGSEIPPIKGPRCRTCSKPIKDVDAPPGLCSAGCLDAADERLSHAAVRKLLVERDKGKCALCGQDTLRDRALADEAIQQGGKALDDALRLLTVTGDYRRKDVLEGRDLWDFDHITPTVAGGKNTLKNARTLCRPCHEKVSAGFASKRADSRKTKGSQWKKGRKFGR